jgi:hypothetical protein
MKIFGYKNKIINEHELLEMSEITFQASPEALKAIANFLNESADKMLEHKANFGHSHLQDEWKNWKEEYPDVIVAAD